MRKTPYAERDFDVAFIGNFIRAVKRVGIVRQRFCHLVVGFEVEFFGFHPHAIRFVYKPLRLDAQKNVLRVRILFFYVMNVVGCDGFDPERAGKRPELRKNFLLFRNPVILQFDIEILTERVVQHACDLVSALILPA